MNTALTSKKQGTIYTFYSFKGGMGRTMTLVNVGVLMAMRGKSVLLVDWDLEAPGIEAYFKKDLEFAPTSEQILGVLDLIENGEKIEWRRCIQKTKELGETLHVITTGSTQNYRQRLQTLNWDELYEKHEIGVYIRKLRHEWLINYDYVLIDSRTGITDIGDICTAFFPDYLLVFFIYNHQSINGILETFERANKIRSDTQACYGLLPPLYAVPVCSREETYDEKGIRDVWRKLISTKLAELYNWLPQKNPFAKNELSFLTRITGRDQIPHYEPMDVICNLHIPYVSFWSFGERIPVIADEFGLKDPNSISSAYNRLTNLLINNLDWHASVLGEGASKLKIDLEIAGNKLIGVQNKLEKQTKKSNIFRIAAIFSGIAAVFFGVYFIYTASKSEQIPAEISLGDQYISNNQLPEAIVVYRAREAVLAKMDNDDSRHQLSTIYNRLGSAYQQQGEFNLALKAFEQQKEVLEKLLTQQPNNPSWQSELAVSHSRGGIILQAQGSLDEALEAFRTHQVLMQKLVKRDEDNLDWQYELAISYAWIGDTLQKQNKLDEAWNEYFEQKKILEGILIAKQPNNTTWQYQLASLFKRMSQIQSNKRNLTEALGLLKQAEQTLKPLTESSDGKLAGKLELMEIYLEQSRVLLNLGDIEKAKVAINHNKDIYLTQPSAIQITTAWLKESALMYEQLADVLSAQNQRVDAEKAYRSSLEKIETLRTENPNNSVEWRQAALRLNTKKLNKKNDEP